MKYDFYSDTREIDLILNEGFTSDNWKLLLNFMQKEEEYSVYIFKNIKDIEWFTYLKETKVFDLSSLPPPKSAKHENIVFTPPWKILDYLVEVSKQVTIQNFNPTGNDILKIIQSLTFYDVSHPEADISEWTWNYFVKILKNLPREKLSLEILGLTKYWLEISENLSQIDHEIFGLISKFLDEKSTDVDVKKAESLISIISKIKWTKSKDEKSKELEEIFGREDEKPELLIDSYWMRKGFENISELVAKYCTNNPIFVIADVLNEIFLKESNQTNYENKKSKPKYDLNVTRKKNFDFEVIIDLYKKGVKDEKSRMVLSAKNCIDPDMLFLKMTQNIPDRVYLQLVIDDIEIRIKDMFRYTFNDYSYIWYSSLNEGPNHSPHDAKEVFSVILTNLLKYRGQNDTGSTMEIFRRFISEEYPFSIFKRLVLYVMGLSYRVYKDYFWEILNENDFDIFTSRAIEPEMYYLLKNNSDQFTITEKKTMRERIENIELDIDDSKRREHRTLLMKQKWFSALKDDQFFSKDYNTYFQKTGIDEKISYKTSEISVGFGSSPLTTDQVLDLKNDSLGIYLKEFQTVNELEEPTVEALASIIESAAQKNPSKFTDDLNPFLNVGYIYVYNLLNGFREAWKSNLALDWENIVKFINAYIESNEFWQDKYLIDDSWRANHNWVIGAIGELFQEGSKNDKHALPNNIISHSISVLTHIVRSWEPDDLSIDTSDPLTHTLNSPIGKILLAILYIALNQARTTSNTQISEERKWSTEIKSIFDYALQKGLLEVYVIVGQYMPNITYLDYKWIKIKVNDFLDLSDEYLWSSFMTGYLFTKVYKNLYAIMFDHYFRSIDFEFQDRYSKDGLIQHLGVAYLNDFDSNLESSPFVKLVTIWNHEQIKKIIGSFWALQEYYNRIKGIESESKQTEKIEVKIKWFWRYFYKKYIDHEKINQNDKLIISDMSKLVAFLGEIDGENYKWLIFTAKYIQYGYNSPYLIENLHQLLLRDSTETSSKYIGEIFIEVLKNYIPDYNKDHIISIVEILFKQSKSEIKNLAFQICDIYGRNGHGFLRGTYEKYI